MVLVKGKGNTSLATSSLSEQIQNRNFELKNSSLKAIHMIGSQFFLTGWCLSRETRRWVESKLQQQRFRQAAGTWQVTWWGKEFKADRLTGRSLGGVISKTLVFSFFGGLSHAACGILVLNLRPLQWTCRVLTIGLQGNCQEKYFLLLFPQYISANFAKRKPLFHKNYFHIKLLCSNDFYVWTHHVD